MLNIIFWVTCYPLIFLMYFLLRNARDKNSWCFGVVLSKEWKKDPEVDIVDMEYRKNLKKMMVLSDIVGPALPQTHKALLFRFLSLLREM